MRGPKAAVVDRRVPSGAGGRGAQGLRGPRRRRRLQPVLGGLLVLALLLGAGCSSGGGGGGSRGGGTGDGLSVTPASHFKVSGFQGGPFVPLSKTYTLKNVTLIGIDWSASSLAPEPWLTIAPTSGQLGPGDEVDVTLTLDPVRLATLGPGVYPTPVDFVNETNGAGTTSREIRLTVGAVAGLEVLPDSGLQTFGVVGGPFSPTSKTYTLRNATGAPLDWSATDDRPWVTLSSSGGTLAPGAQAAVVVSIAQGAAAALPIGSHTGTVDFVNETDGAGTTSREVRLDASTSGGGGTSGTLSQFGITWDFAQSHPVGQFANGDWWVVGPVTVVGITPGSTEISGRTRNGSMVNPSPTLDFAQGYDSAMYGIYNQPGYYDPGLNAALDVSPSSPLVLQPGSSLVSTISDPVAGSRPQLLSAAVLTVLAAPAPADGFRPPYCGNDKTVRFSASNLDPNGLLQSLARAPIQSLPELTIVERWFERPWLAHIPLWYGPSYMHPKSNLPNYGREMADRVGIASLVLNLDFAPAQKQRLLVRFVQVGIDYWGILEDGGRNIWQAGAGFNHGHKWPILFAGLMLDDPDMSGVGLDPTLLFQGEDGQTFYVEETSPGVYNNGFGGYGPQHVGMAEWGIKHSTVQSDDSVAWTAPYRECCTANAWYGQILAARIMPGARALWNHEPLFDYQDRFLRVTRQNGSPHWVVSWSDFPLEMWDRYRSQF